MSKKLKASEEFVAGKNGIGWVGSNFKSAFADMEFTYDKKRDETLATKKLERRMTDKEIGRELRPEVVLLGDLLHVLTYLDRSDWYIFYINDRKGTLWAVYASCISDNGSWYVEAHSVEDPLGWGDGGQVVLRRFLDAKNPAQALKNSDAMPNELIINGEFYDKRV